jgi:hypothetical protein
MTSDREIDGVTLDGAERVIHVLQRNRIPFSARRCWPTLSLTGPSKGRVAQKPVESPMRAIRPLLPASVARFSGRSIVDTCRPSPARCEQP